MEKLNPTVREATLAPDPAHDGMWRHGETSIVAGAQTIQDALDIIIDIQNMIPEADESLDGKIYNQDGGRIYRLNLPDGPAYFLLWLVAG